MERDLTTALSEAARSVSKAGSVDEALESIVHAAQLSLPGFDHVGVSTVDRQGNITTRAQTGELVKQLDDLQYSLGEGPCVDSLREAYVVEAPDIKHDQRWPRYVPAAVDRGLLSQLAVKLYLDEEGTLGGLNIYSTRSKDIDPEAVAAADLFATHAALALGKVRELSNLNHALASRETIGKAIGVIMAKYDLDEQAAFGFLARLSSHANIKVRELATQILREHEEELGAKLGR
jgi:GAF domain-containing protein